MRKIFDAIGLRFDRTLRAKAGTPGALLLVQDYTNPEELDLQANLAFFTQIADDPIPTIGRVLGADSNCGAVRVSVPPHAPANRLLPVA